MRFHGLMLLRDEEDVIAETLTHLLTWIDVLHVYDLGSTDQTWEIVQHFAARDTRIQPFKHLPTVYHDGLRCVLFDRFRSGFENGDWILKIDGDEFYPIPPPQFVKERLQPDEGLVHLQWYFFRLTTDETAAYESGSIPINEDRKRSIIDRRRYYKVSQYSEPRMFRYRPTMQWPSTTHWPYNAGLLARERIPVLHYPHRDPIQLSRRFALRSAMMRRNAAAGGHWKTNDWHGELVDNQTGIALGAEKGEGLSGGYGIDSGPLLYWPLGTILPEVSIYQHLPSIPKRTLQRLIYSALLPVLDSRRPSFDSSFRAKLISTNDNDQIGRVCQSAEEQFRHESS